MILVETDLKNHPVPPPAMGKDTFHYTRLLQAPSTMKVFCGRLLGAGGFEGSSSWDEELGTLGVAVEPSGLWQSPGSRAGLGGLSR